MTPEARAAAVQRVLSGETAASVARAIGENPNTVRKWVERAKAAGVTSTVVELAPPVDTSTLSPIELLEHDVARVRRQMDRCEETGHLAVVPPLWNQLRKMQAELSALRAAVPENREASAADRVEILTAHMRVLRWCRDVVADRQARVMMARALQERTDP